MTQEFIATMGLPASWKSSWALAYQKTNPNTVIVTKDDLRLEHPDYNENKILELRNNIIETALKEGKNVISADTNLNPIHLKTFIRLGKKYNVRVKVQDFTLVPPSVCVERDSKRDKPVGAKAIFDMWKQYLDYEKVSYDGSLPKAVICDIDGTIALHNRSPFDYARCNTDSVNMDVLSLIQYYKSKGFVIIFMSGRPSEWRTKTEEWLIEHDIPYDHLFMRASGDFRDDVIVKYELFNNHVRNVYNVFEVFDDRPRVCRLWRRLGLNLTEVGDGYEF